MKSMKYIQFLSACLLIPVLFGCQQEKLDQVDGIGSPVKFAVATGYETETRTEFSGVLTGTSSTVERIDWVNGDVFRVNDGALQSTDLTVSAHSDNGQQSVATISGTSLVWENASATFYALYPAPASGNSVNLSTNTATGTIPSAQTVTLSGREYKADMANYGYMCASATASAGSAVSLVFKPLMTAFRFQIYAMDGCAPTANLTSVSLSSASTKLAGDFTATIGANSTFTASVVGTGSNTVSASLGTGLALSTTEPVTVTLLALPVLQDQLTLTLNFSDNTTRSIPFKQNGNWVSVQPGQKMYVDNLDVPAESRWNYFLDDLGGPVELIGHNAVTSGLGFTVKSYKYNTFNPSTNEAVAWTVEYSTDGTNWHSTPAAAGIGNRFTLSQDHGNGGAAGEAVTAQIRAHDGTNPVEYTSGNSVLDAETAAMRAKTIPSNALDNGYYDLSKHAVYGSSFYGPATTQETANTYVIDRPGKYKFPAYWGNARRNDADNTIAYAPQGTGSNVLNNSDHYMRRFQRHDGKEISNTNIIGQIGGGAANSVIEIIWQTGTSEILKESDITYNFRTNASDNYIYFEIKEENIRPGNILIGLYYSGGFYIWSWNIWVTNQDLTPTDNFLPCNLGWTNSPTATTAKWADWDFYVKVKQAGSGLEKIYEVHQIGEGTEAGAERGNSLYYQWGRKDPFPVDWADYQMYHGHTISTAAAANTNSAFQSSLGTVGGMRADHAINQPYTIFVNATTHHWLQGTEANSLIGNLWDATLIPYQEGVASQAPVKSIYDPSPRGFVVPNSGVFSNFSTSSPSNYVANEGWNFGTGTGTVFFPLGGGKNEIGTALTGGYVWSTTSDPHNNATNKHKSQVLEFNGSTVSPVTHHNKAELLPVRPVVQTKFQ